MPDKPAAPRFVVLAAVLGLATALGVVAGTEYYLGMLRAGRPIGWIEAVTSELFRWYTWAALVPAIALLARRIRDLSPRWWAAAALHAVAAVAVAWVVLSLYAVYTELTTPLFAGSAGSMGSVASVSSAGSASTAAAAGGLVTGRLVPVFLLSKTATGIITYLGILGGYFAFEYAQRYRERAVLAAELQARLADARLDALKRQLQPHFLFNTLHAVSSLMLDGRTSDAISMMGRLGDLLRLTLQSDRALETTMEDELIVLDHYLDIERVRFGDRLHVDLDIDPACLAARVPALVLQPLVENAVRHAVAVRSGPCCITIRAHRDDAAFVLAVEDDGPGFAADARADGIGLANTEERLRQLYGHAASLTRDNRAAGGARVMLRLPLSVDASKAA